MTLYAVGDIQGCSRAFDALLAAIRFDPRRDRLWLAGDLVNRGPDSLGVLRTVAALGDCVTTVLGNHDLHLLATAAGLRTPGPDDSLDDILDAPDCVDLLDWLRFRPLLHYDSVLRRVLVHAGLPPHWTATAASAAARDVESLLQSARWQHGLADMYGDAPTRWRADLSRAETVRYTINALTRIRYCSGDGALDFEHKGAPGSQPDGLVPWFDHPHRAETDVHVVFGHWASLGVMRRADVTATDSGCVWGRSLTAIPLDLPGEPVTVDCSDAGCP